MHSWLLGSRASIPIANTDMKTKQSVTHSPDRSEWRTATGPSLRRRNDPHSTPPWLVARHRMARRPGTGWPVDPEPDAHRRPCGELGWTELWHICSGPKPFTSNTPHAPYSTRSPSEPTPVP